MIGFVIVVLIAYFFIYCLCDIAKSADEGMKKRLSMDFEEPI